MFHRIGQPIDEAHLPAAARTEVSAVQAIHHTDKLEKRLLGGKPAHVECPTHIPGGKSLRMLVFHYERAIHRVDDRLDVLAPRGGKRCVGAGVLTHPGIAHPASGRRLDRATKQAPQERVESIATCLQGLDHGAV